MFFGGGEYQHNFADLRMGDGRERETHIPAFFGGREGVTHFQRSQDGRWEGEGNTYSSVLDRGRSSSSFLAMLSGEGVRHRNTDFSL